MGNRDESTTVSIHLSADQAKEKIKELQALVKSLNKELNDTTKGDPVKRGALSHDIEEAKNKIEALRASVKENINLIINGDTANKNLRDVQTALKQVMALRSQLATQPNTPEFAQLSYQAAILKQKELELLQPMKDFQRSLALAGQDGSLNRLKLRVEILRAELDKLSPASENFAAKRTEFRKVDDQFQKLNATINGTGGLFGFLKSQVAQFGILAAGYLGFQAIVGGISNIIQRNADLSDSIADIQMVSGLTVEEVRKLNTEFGKLDTRTATKDLRDIAIVAGQFGVAKNEILQFTEAVNQTAVVLSTEFKGGTEEIAMALAKLRNVLTDVKTDKIDADIMHLGNALIKLAQDGVATAPVITDFANRIGGSGRQFGLTTGQILGLSATLQELAVSTERGGTAISRILQKMATHSEEFAKIAGYDGTAGKSLKDFQHLIDTDIYGAFLKFVEGTKKGGESAVAYGLLLKDAELSGAGAGEVIGKLANNQLLLSQRVTMAGEAIGKTDSITAQYKIKNETLGAELEKLNKSFTKLVSSTGIQTWFIGVVASARGLIATLSVLPETISRNSTALLTLAGITAIYYGAVIKSTAETILNSTAHLINTGIKKAKLTLDGLLIGSELAYGYAVDAVTGKITVATAVTKIWNLVSAANPIGAVIAILAGVVVAINAYSKNTKEALALEKEKLDLTLNLIKTNGDLERSITLVNFQLEHLNRLTPIERNELEQTIRTKYEDARATLMQLEADQEKIRLDATKPGVWQMMWNSLQQGAGVMQNASDAVANGKEAADAYNDAIKANSESVKQLKTALGTLTDVNTAEATAMGISNVTIENYNEKLRLLKIALGAAAIGGEDFLRIQKEIAEASAALNKANETPDIGGDTKKLDDFKNKMAALVQQLRELQTAAIKDEAQKALATLADRYQKEREAAIKNQAAAATDDKLSAEQIKQLASETDKVLLQMSVTYLSEKKSITEKYSKELAEWEYNENLKNITKWHDAEKTKIMQQYADGKISKTQYHVALENLEVDFGTYMLTLQKDYGRDTAKTEEDIAAARVAAHEKGLQEIVKDELARLQVLANGQLAGTQGRLNAEIELLIAQGEKKKEIYQNDAAALKAIDAETNAQIAALKNAYFQEQVALVKKYFDGISQVATAFMTMQASKENAALAHDKKINDLKKLNWQHQLDAKRISQDQFNFQIAKLDEQQRTEEATIKKKQFERGKTVAIIQAIINTALAISEASPVVPLMILAGVVGAAQIAVIASQPVPEFKHGGILPVTKEGGISAGPLHRDGGIDLINTTNGEHVGNIEGGEPILSLETAKNNPVLTKALLDASLSGGREVEFYTVEEVNQRAIAAAQIIIEAKALVNKQASIISPITTDAKALVNKQSSVVPPVTTDAKALVNKQSSVVSPIATDAKALVNRQSSIGSPVTIDAKALVNKQSLIGTPITTDAKALVNKLGRIDEMIQQLSAKALVNRIKNLSDFVPAELPQINSERISENLGYQRFGYSNIIQQSQEHRIQTPDAIGPNNFTNGLDPFQQQMLQVMKDVKDVMATARDAYKEPKQLEAYVVLQKLNDQIALSERVKKGAQVK